MTPNQHGLGTTLIILGLFLWFALAFNGGVGETFVNYSLFTSALLMIIFGVTKIVKAKRVTMLCLGLASLVLYLPMIWQRFNFSFGPDTGGLMFDILIMAVLVVSLMFSPKQSHQRGN